MQFISRIIVILIYLLICDTSYAFAYTEAFSVGGSKVTVFAPDWIWQGQNVNIMFVAENKNTAEKKIDFRLSLPEENKKYFDLPGELSTSGDIPANGKLRLAITGIVPKRNIPLGKYSFFINISSDSLEEQIEYPLKVIRGSLVEAGIWSVLLPALIALLWGTSFCFVLPRFSRKGAWRKKSPPFAEYIEKKEWFNE